MIPVEADGGIGDGAPPPMMVYADYMPERFHGVWNQVDGSCNPASELRVEITPTTIEFYESHGEIMRIVVEAPNNLVVALTMEGEGEKWDMAHRFTLSDDGDTLTSSPLIGEEQFEPIPLKRCTS